MRESHALRFSSLQIAKISVSVITHADLVLFDYEHTH